MLLFLHLIVLVAVNIEAKNIQLSLGSIDVESVTKSSQDSSHLDSVTKSLHSKSSQDTTGLLVTTLVDGIRPGSARSSIEVALYGCGGSIEAFLPPAAFLIYIPEKCEQVLQSISCIEGTVHLPSSLRSPLLSSAGSLNDLPIRIIRVDFVAGYLNELETTLQTILVTERVTIAPISAKSAVISALSLCEYASCTVDSQSDLCGNSCFLSNTLIETIASLTGVFWIERIQKHSTSNIHARAVTQTTDLVNWPGISQEYGLCGDVSTCAFKDDIPFSLLKSLYPTIGSTVSDNNNKTQSKSNNINYERINKPLRRTEIKKKKKKISKTAPSRPLTKMSSSIRSPSLPTIQDLLFNQETFSLKRSPSLPTRQRALLNQTDCTATCSGPACGLGYSSCGGFESPLNILGLDGTGQLIQVVDSGLDFNNPFFYDTAVAVNPSKLPPSGLSTHRKVVAYWSYMDALDELGGHGTHVAGSVAGNAAPVSSVDDSLMLDTLSGMAPGAKIYFTDVSCETPGGCTPPASIPTSCTQCSGDGLYVPLNIFDLFKPAYNIGSRISTNSWGGGFSVYSSLSADIDSYVVSRPDHLIIFAAGNDGAEAGFTSLSIQAVSKNVLSVGATRDGLLAHMIKINGFNDVSGGGYINPLFGQGTPKSCGGILRTAILYGLLPNEAPICETPTNDYCSQLSLDAFQVPFSVPGDISGSYLFSDGAFFDLPLCCGCTPKQIFDGFYALNLPTSFSSVLSYFETTYNARLASEFTSRGPTLDGRIKPDMVAPGVDIISARANGGVK
jgi:subtilisin family serine protease